MLCVDLCNRAEQNPRFLHCGRIESTRHFKVDFVYRAFYFSAFGNGSNLQSDFRVNSESYYTHEISRIERFKSFFGGCFRLVHIGLARRRSLAHTARHVDDERDRHGRSVIFRRHGEHFLIKRIRHIAPVVSVGYRCAVDRLYAAHGKQSAAADVNVLV